MTNLRIWDWIEWAERSKDIYCAESVEHQQGDVRDIAGDEERALPTLELAQDKRRDERDADDGEAKRKVQDGGLRVDGKRSAEFARGDKSADRQDQGDVYDVCADDIADGQVRLFFDDSGHGGDELGQRCAYGEDRDADKVVRHAEFGRKHRAVVAHQLRAQDDACGAKHKQDYIFGDIGFFYGQTRAFDSDSEFFAVLLDVGEHAVAHRLFLDWGKIRGCFGVLFGAYDIFRHKSDKNREYDDGLPPHERPIARGGDRPEHAYRGDEQGDLCGVVLAAESGGHKQQRQRHYERDIAVDRSDGVADRHTGAALCGGDA